MERGNLAGSWFDWRAAGAVAVGIDVGRSVPRR